MSSRECIVCGRPIKTGRKYCWEHRNSQVNSKERIFNEGTKAYYQHKVQRGDKIFGSTYYSLIFAWTIIWIYLAIKQIVQIPWIIFLALGGYFVCMVITIILATLLGVKTKYAKRTMGEIVNRDREYVDYMKSYIDADKEEKEFKKSLFK